MWSYINSVIGRPKSDTNNRVSPDTINDFFQHVAISPQHHSASSFTSFPSNRAANAFTFKEISVSTVLAHLSNLDVRKSMGADGLSATFLREVANEIVVPLTSLYNQSLQNGVIPSAWKQSHITPVHKGGPLDNPSNYRPISVLPITVKVLEKIVASQFSSYLEENQLLHPHQGAF